MKRLHTRIYILLLSTLVACQQDIPMVSLGIDNLYVMSRMRKAVLHPEYSGEGYRWTMKDQNGKDSIVSEERDYVFLAQYPGEYYLRLNIIDRENPVEHDIHFIVKEEEVLYSRYISNVYQYCPAPGQFINTLPLYKKGDTAEDMRQKAEESLANSENNSGNEEERAMVSLGGYGGYITFGFDHTVVNVPGEKDFKILGNAFYAEANPNPEAPKSGGSCEPGIVMVSLDLNQNGIPDDEWYELAGSEYYNPETKHEYQITYYRPDPNKIPTPKPGTPLTDTTYIAWKSNYGETGYIIKNEYHGQSYYPLWSDANAITFTGTKLANNAVDESGGKGSFFVLYSYDWGYVDNHPNDKEDKISFDIGWAVDKNGNSVYLPGADFIRVYTGVNQTCGWLGETSTEINGAEDLHIEKRGETLPNP